MIAKTNLSSPLRRVIKKDKSDYELRSAFSDADLCVNNDYYFNGQHRLNSFLGANTGTVYLRG